VILRKHSIFDVSFIRPSPEQLLVSWLIPLLEGILFAALAFARGRRYAFSAGRLSLWTAIAVSQVRSRPPSHTGGCEYCNKPFTLPHADGTEVFEPVTTS
jgi:hypothetical protein